MNPPFLLVFFIRVRKQGRGLLCSRSFKGSSANTHTTHSHPAVSQQKPSRLLQNVKSLSGRRANFQHFKNITCRCESGEQHTHQLRSHVADSTQSWQQTSPGVSSVAANSLQQNSSSAQLPSGVLIPDTNQLTWGVDRIPPAD